MRDTSLNRFPELSLLTKQLIRRMVETEVLRCPETEHMVARAVVEGGRIYTRVTPDQTTVMFRSYKKKQKRSKP